MFYKTVAFVFLFVVVSKSYCQNFKRKADSLYQVKNYSDAAPLYLKAASFEEFKATRASDYYDAACCFALAANSDSAFTYLKKATQLGWNDKEHLLKDGDLSSLHSEKEWKR